MTPLLWVLIVPRATPSLNEFTNKRDLYAYIRLRARWEKYLRDAWYVARSQRPALAGFVPPDRARLLVYRYSAHAIDRDNCIGGLKPVIDALRRLERIADDDPASLQLVVKPIAWTSGATRLVLEPWQPEDQPHA